jgi:hypothetical protein
MDNKAYSLGVIDRTVILATKHRRDVEARLNRDETRDSCIINIIKTHAPWKREIDSWRSHMAIARMSAPTVEPTITFPDPLTTSPVPSKYGASC